MFWKVVPGGTSGVLPLLILGAVLNSGLVDGQVNIALGCPANSSSVFSENGKTYGPASEVVDGDKNAFLDGGSCLLTDRVNTPLAWLRIDLGTMSVVQRIEMTNRKGGNALTASAAKDRDHQRILKGFTMAVTNTTIIPPGVSDICYSDPGNGLPDVFQNRTCPFGHQIGRYVVIYNRRTTTRDAKLEICEVEVIGCPVGYHGQNCSLPCGHCVDGQCQPNNGSCMFGCTQGYRDDKCMEECDEGYYGLNCGGKCGKCDQDLPCDHVTGVCAMGCASEHSGSKCTRVNLAFERPTSVSGIFGNVSSNVTVDGNKTDGQCFSTSKGAKYAWWRVDLGRPAVIDHVVIDVIGSNVSKSLIRKRLHGFEITVSEDERGTTGHVCYKDMEEDLPDLVQNRTCEVVGRYVTITIDRKNNQTETSGIYSNKAVLQLCEVEVVGCPHGSYGQNCEFSCPAQCTDTTCFSNATCAFGCNGGYQGSFCNETCGDGHYGNNCRLMCGQCSANSACNRVDGVCSLGCQSGWTGDLCKTPCAAGYYGANCTEECGSCMNETACNHTNGICHDGCASGFKDTPSCQEECENFTFGMNCSERCGMCSNGSACEQTTGLCTEGCIPGWHEPYCMTACVVGYYGANCTEECGSCMNETVCNHTNGVCHDGCASGFKDTPFCQEECEEGSFGTNCTGTCGQCEVGSTCDNINGTCTEGCEPGWRPPMCITECLLGRYGKDCNGTCGKCDNDSVCDSVNGSCPGPCQPGWRSPLCQEVCMDFSFGEHCSHQCGHCRNNETCDHVNGTCENGCAPGWRLPECTEECMLGRYGKDCNGTCGECDNDSDCDSVNGSCPGPCQPGWRSPLCQEECMLGRYGKDCNGTCGECDNDSDCDSVNGSCPGPCQPGWRSPLCQEVCMDFSFGEHCSHQCGHCRNNETCDHVNGTCENGCAPGWRLPECTEECMLGRYGKDCNGTCGECDNDSDCDSINGSCPGPCQPGWRSPLCQEECMLGRYGKDCNGTCGECDNDSDCDSVNGSCPGPCQPGWRSPLCQEVCQPGYYGHHCRSNCGACQNGTICDHVSGACAHRCDKGWQGIKCNKECDGGYFWENCEETCGHCKPGSTCNRTDGKCPDGCKVGWQGPRCLKECDPSFYGASCSSRCGQCLHGESCNHISGRCANGCEKDWMSPQCDQKIEQQSSGVAVASGVGGFVVILVVIGIIGIFYRRKNRKTLNPKESGELVEIQTTDLPTFLSKRLQSNELQEEFKLLPDGAVHACEAGQRPENKSRNRFLTTFPYDHSRVVLTGEENDYINANYIDSVEKKDAYVATQGPKKNTLEHFWRMMWQIKSDRIVMLANCIEMGKHKVEQYWPEKGQSRDFGDYRVVTTNEQTFAAFSVRKLSLYENTCEMPREIMQFHFTKWPDHGIPDILHLVNFYKHVQSTETRLHGPMVVHCSAGIGRTGTFIAIDALVEYATLKGRVVPFDYAKVMRQNRMNMIQTKDQYVAVHQVLMEYLLCEDASLTVEEFQDSDDVTRLQEEFTTLSQYRPSITLKESSDAMSEENISKNKDLEILPANRYRPFLMSQSPERTNYINAVILPSCKTEIAFLVTQMPSDDTLDEFWAMVFDYQSTAIVILDPDDQILPTHSSPTVTTQSFSVEYVPIDESTDNYDHVHVQSITLTRKGLPDSFLTNTFEVTRWPNDDSQCVIPMIKANYAVQSSQYSLKSPGPITVVCRNGSDRCGVFCAVSNAAETLNLNRSANLFLTIRQLQSRRPSFIRSLHEYRTCYRALAAHCETICDYGNV